LCVCFARALTHACQADAAAAAASAGAVASLVTAAKSRLCSPDVKELVVAALISLISHPAVADDVSCQGVLALMIDVLGAQPRASLAVAALQCCCLLMFGRGDMCTLAAEKQLLHTLTSLRSQDYGEEFESLSMNADAVLLLYK
jgi:hypothetical protein